MAQYEAFAQYYDTLICNVDYPARAAYFDRVITAFGGLRGILLDVACGTGSLSFELEKLGYDVIGADLSEEMLGIANEKRYEYGSKALFLNQSMQQLDLYGTVDAAVCALDSVNHITDPDELIKGFEKVALFLHPDGVFVFDVNTVYKHEHILANETFVYECDDVYCVWQNEYRPETRCVEIHLDFFEECEDGRYKRQEEAFCERAYTDEEICRILRRAGLQVVARYDSDSFDPVRPDSQRVVYVAKHRKSQEHGG